MATIRRKALAFQQGSWRVFLTTIPAKELRRFTTIDRWDGDLAVDSPRQGYQRVAEPPRLKKFANFLVRSESPLSPTTLLLSSRNANLHFNPETEEILLNSDTPLQLVDGQHRAEGFSYAVYEKKEERLALFEVPIIIVEGLDKIEEMRQFAVVNGTQKSVRTDLVNMILTQIQAQRGDEAVLPREAWKVVVSRVVAILNTKPDAPWFGQIVMPNESVFTRDQVAEDPARVHQRIVRATSFMTSLKPIYEYLRNHEFVAGSLEKQAEQMAAIINEYWQALQELMPGVFEKPGDYVLQKTPGLFALHIVLKRFLPIMHTARRKWVSGEFKIMLGPCEDLCDPNYWLADGVGASRYGSMKGFAELADLLWDSQQLAVAS